VGTPTGLAGYGAEHLPFDASSGFVDVIEATISTASAFPLLARIVRNRHVPFLDPTRALGLLAGSGLLGAACHAVPTTLDLDASAPDPLKRPWATEELCAQGVFISNRAAGEEANLSVRDVDVHAGPQVVELTTERDGSFRDMWRLILMDVHRGEYRIHNVRPPYNFLTSALDARGASGNADVSELAWILRRANPTDEGDSAWFELSAVLYPERRLAVSSSTLEVEWLTPADAGVTSRWAQWALRDASLCGL
jgi:hypothetical protein